MPALFKTTLDPGLLVSMLRVFLDILSDSPAAEFLGVVKAYMEGMSRVPRFSTVVLFMSGDEKELVNRIWEALGGDVVEELVPQAKNAWRIS